MPSFSSTSNNEPTCDNWRRFGVFTLLLSAILIGVLNPPDAHADICASIKAPFGRGCEVINMSQPHAIRVSNGWGNGSVDQIEAEDDPNGGQVADLQPTKNSDMFWADTDGYRAFKTCITRGFKRTYGYLGHTDVPFEHNRWEHSTSMWYRLHDDEDVFIQSIVCGGPGQPAPSVRIRNINSAMCLVARNNIGENPVVQSWCAGFADQRWQLVPVGGVVQIRNHLSGKCVATRGTGESLAIATTCGEQWADQLWRLEFDAGAGAYRFRNLNSQLCLVVRGNNADAQAVQSTCGQWPDQLWTIPSW